MVLLPPHILLYFTLTLTNTPTNSFFLTFTPTNLHTTPALSLSFVRPTSFSLVRPKRPPPLTGSYCNRTTFRLYQQEKEKSRKNWSSPPKQKEKKTHKLLDYEIQISARTSIPISIIPSNSPLMARLSVLVVFLLGLISYGWCQEEGKWRIHTLFSVECQNYFDWQTIGVMHSFKKAKQPGPITRLLSCTDEEKKTYKGVDLAPTFEVPSMSKHPKTGDW